MTLPIERARAGRPVTWLTLLGILLLPVVIGAILVGALYNPTERLDAMTAAIVNDDEPVTIDGQYTPLGRQLAAGLVAGSDDVDGNLTWVLSNSTDATEGLSDGRYQAVVTIPAGFSAAATSAPQGLGGADEPAERATIVIQTPPDSLVVDDAITAQLAQAAAATMGRELTALTLENVLLGFTTLGTELGEAADGAHQLADGAHSAASGAHDLADGASTAASGAADLTGGATLLADGAGALAPGAREVSAGVAASAAGLRTWADGAGDVAAGTDQLADGLGQLAAGAAALPTVPQSVIDAANGFAADAGRIQQEARDAAVNLRALADDCAVQGGTPQFCALIEDAADRAEARLPDITAAIAQAGAVAGGVEQLVGAGAQLTGGLQAMSASAGTLADAVRSLASGADTAAAGLGQLAAGASAVADGVDGVAAGAAGIADGTGALSAGITGLADGTASLADGVDGLAGGTTTLADGLDQAVASIPSYTEPTARNLAEVMSDPVGAEGTGAGLFGASAVPLLATIALWFGALASYTAMQAVTRRALTARGPSVMLALRAFAPGAGLGVAQGVLVAAVVQPAAGFDVGAWWAFAALCALAGVVFAAVNQALVAVAGGAGRWIAALVGVLAVAAGVVSTVPAPIAGLADVLPPAPVFHAMVGALTGAGGVGAGVVAAIVWALLGLAATTAAVAAHRTTSVRAVLAASAA